MDTGDAQVISSSLQAMSAAAGMSAQAQGDEWQRKWADKQYAKARKWQEEQTEKANQWNLDMWNKSNAYNSLSAQMQRAQEAGVNPYGILENQGAATAQGAVNMGNPGAASSHPRDIQGYFNQLGNSLGNAVQSYLTAEQIDTQNKSTQIQFDTQRIELCKQLNELLASQSFGGIQAENFIQQMIEDYGFEYEDTTDEAETHFNPETGSYEVTSGGRNLNRLVLSGMRSQKSGNEATIAENQNRRNKALYDSDAMSELFGPRGEKQTREQRQAVIDFYKSGFNFPQETAQKLADLHDKTIKEVSKLQAEYDKLEAETDNITTDTQIQKAVHQRALILADAVNHIMDLASKVPVVGQYELFQDLGGILGYYVLDGGLKDDILDFIPVVGKYFNKFAFGKLNDRKQKLREDALTFQKEKYGKTKTTTKSDYDSDGVLTGGSQTTTRYE